MKYSLHLLSFLLIVVLFTRCKGKPSFTEYINVGGYVIGKETCNTNEADDYWLIDLTYYTNTPQYGDTLVLNGVTYTNVVKVKGLDPSLKIVGMRVAFQLKIVSAGKIETMGCNVSNPITYKLKELFFISQGEIR